MKIHLLKILLILLPSSVVFGQGLFDDPTPLETSIRVSIQEVKKNTTDSSYTLESLHFKNNAGKMDSILIGIRGRGNFRYQECYYPPLKINIKKKEAKETLFEKNRKLKLVMPCKNQSGNNELVIKEFLCYKLYEIVSAQYFQTRLLKLQYNEERKKKIVSNDFYAFVIEDDEDVAKRLNAKIIERSVPALALNDTIGVINDFFQYLIGNLDYSLGTQHNAKLFFNTTKMHYPIAYDFDMSGFVNPPYWTTPVRNGVAVTQGSATDRIYLGYCRPESLFQWVRQSFLKHESEIIKTMKEYDSFFSTGESKRLNSFVNDFFEILKNDKNFSREILDACRK